MNTVDDRTDLEILSDSDIVDIIIQNMRENYLSIIAGSDEQEVKKRETTYLKIRMLPDIKREFQALINNIGDD